MEPVKPVVSWDLATYLDNLGSRIDAGFASLNKALESKADKADLAGINARLDGHEREIAQLRDKQQQDEAAQKALKAVNTTNATWRRWMIDVGIAAIGTGGLLYGVLR